jgi:hypothetical protein
MATESHGNTQKEKGNMSCLNSATKKEEQFKKPLK